MSYLGLLYISHNLFLCINPAIDGLVCDLQKTAFLERWSGVICKYKTIGLQLCNFNFLRETLNDKSI